MADNYVFTNLICKFAELNLFLPTIGKWYTFQLPSGTLLDYHIQSMNKQQPGTDCGKYSEDGTQFLRLEDKSITSYEVREGVTVIATEAFADCPNLKSVTLPYTLTGIGEMAFFNCESLETITMYYSVKTIGDYAFSGCSHLKSIVIPRHVESIGKCAFNGCI